MKEIKKLSERLLEILQKETGFTGKLIIHCKDGVPLAIEHSFTERIN